MAARQRSRYLRYLARPPQEKQLIEARKQQQRRRRTEGVVREAAGTLTVLALVCVVAFGKSATTEYSLNHVINTAFTRCEATLFA